MIKQLLILSIVFLTTCFSLTAQSLEIIPQVSYTFGGRIYANLGELKIEDSESYGLSFNIVNRDISFQIEYFYQPTTGNYLDYLDPSLSQSSDLRINWYQIGVRKRFATDKKVVPFAGLSLGLTNFVLESTPERQDENALSFGVQAGTNIYLSDRLGLRFHGRLNFPVQFNGFGFYAGTGGSGFGASASGYFIQADFGAGLIIRLSE